VKGLIIMATVADTKKPFWKGGGIEEISMAQRLFRNPSLQTPNHYGMEWSFWSRVSDGLPRTIHRLLFPLRGNCAFQHLLRKEKWRKEPVETKVAKAYLKILASHTIQVPTASRIPENIPRWSFPFYQTKQSQPSDGRSDAIPQCLLSVGEPSIERGAAGGSTVHTESNLCSPNSSAHGV
jgi:hypothetical protein